MERLQPQTSLLLNLAMMCSKLGQPLEQHSFLLFWFLTSLLFLPFLIGFISFFLFPHLRLHMATTVMYTYLRNQGFLMTLKFTDVVKWKSVSVPQHFTSPFTPCSKFWISSSTTWRLLGTTWTRRPSRRCDSSRWSSTTAPFSSPTKCGSEWAHASRYRLAALLVSCKHFSLPLSVLPHHATMPMFPLILKTANQQFCL